MPFFASCLVLVLQSGCTNNLRVMNFLSSLTAPTPSAQAPTNNETVSFVLSRVLKNNLNPTGTLDLVGDGSGTLGSICQNTGSSSNSSNSCTCVYTYSSQSLPNQKVEVPVIYTETDLVRCNYGTLASDVTSFKVSIHLTTADLYSNSVLFTFSGNGNTLDTTQSSSFLQPKRFQCSDILTVGYLFDPSVYDPFQSENYKITYPLDFYFTNPGGNLAVYSAAYTLTGNPGLANWSCPPIPEPSRYLSSSANNFHATKDDLSYYNEKNHSNLFIYSKGALPTGLPANSKVIYPPPSHSPSNPLASGEVDRSTFYLAKQPSGVFGVPVNAYVAPGINTLTGSSSGGFPPPPLGYGARPSFTGTGQETCPDSSVKIPSGFHWMKLWLFRTSLPQRSIYYPGSGGTNPGQSSSLLQISGIYCNPGNWRADPNITSGSKIIPVFEGCPRDVEESDLDQTRVSASLSIKGVINQAKAGGPHFLADRILSTRQCVRLNAFSGDMTQSGAFPYLTNYYNNYKIRGTFLTPCTNGPGFACGTEKEDRWATWVLNENAAAPDLDAFGVDSGQTSGYLNALKYGCKASPLVDPLNVCSTYMSPQTYGTPKTAPAAPFSMNVTSQALDTGSARFDFLFVVTPPSIMLADMQNGTAASLPYQPYRFYTDTDCQEIGTNQPSRDPDATYALDPSRCNPMNAMTTFGLKLHDVGSNGDPPADDPGRNGIFPVCVLQPD
ncbi:MAG: hypothetical protein ACO3A2_05960 [Bdellovibrionia bacterium]